METIGIWPSARSRIPYGDMAIEGGEDRTYECSAQESRRTNHVPDHGSAHGPASTICRSDNLSRSRTPNTGAEPEPLRSDGPQGGQRLGICLKSPTSRWCLRVGAQESTHRSSCVDLHHMIRN